MRASLAVAAALAAALVPAGVRVAAQQSPFLPETVYGALVNELSGDMAFEHIRWFTHYHRPMGGSDGYRAVERYVEQKAREYGLEDVRVITMPSTKEGILHACNKCVAWTVAHMPGRIQEIVPLDNN